MSSRGWNRLDDTEDYELHATAAHANYDTGRIACSHGRGLTQSLDDWQNLIPDRRLSDISAAAPSHKPSPSLPLGRPTVKKRFHTLHLLAAAISLICFALAITAVANENISWRLGIKNYQLIVLGFLLGIMNLCLGSVVPTLLLHVEARFGSSTLQNYNGILRNEVSASGLSPLWRIVLSMLVALPLALSVAYKTFTGGESTKKIDAATYIGNTTYYGMFAQPGLQLLAEKKGTGISLFSNATLPFAMASAMQNGSEPPLPAHPQAYGFNILLLNNETSAALDAPQPSYVSAVQTLLVGGESWNITARVFATVATYNHSRSQDPDIFEEYSDSFCEDARASSGAYTHMTAVDGWSVVLLNHASPGDQTLQYIGLTPDPGTWSITRGGIQLVEGSCSGNILPPDRQEIIVHNRLFLGVAYMSSLVELLAPFVTTRNNSEWTSPYMATGVAAMLWSRTSVVNSPISQDKTFITPKELARLTADEAGLVYPVVDTAVYIRPTLRKSGLLYFVLGIQPLLIVIILILIASVFHSTPLDKGFGLISILAGIDRQSLDMLAGAALSGELKKSVKLVMRPIRDDQKGAIEYYVTTSSRTAPPIPHGKLSPQTLYH
ncbi:MAG: hypothetical protein L6R38_007797 [Xanthoria sp. 2 TBL-2021]|nr:MAG: hypothetical protein L6R38_007797 [Xanthoria sp. 2 TBL-2021]